MWTVDTVKITEIQITAEPYTLKNASSLKFTVLKIATNFNHQLLPIQKSRKIWFYHLFEIPMVTNPIFLIPISFQADGTFDISNCNYLILHYP